MFGNLMQIANWTLNIQRMARCKFQKL